MELFTTKSHEHYDYWAQAQQNLVLSSIKAAQTVPFEPGNIAVSLVLLLELTIKAPVGVIGHNTGEQRNNRYTTRQPAR